MKNLDQVIREGNSTVNQNIKSKFVGQHVYCNVGTLVQPFIESFDIENAPFNMEDIENMFEYPEFRAEFADFEGGSEENKQEEIERLKELAENNEIDFNKLGILEGEIEELENLEAEPQEIFEWWAVSDFLYEKLKALNHPVLDAGSCLVWGRCTTGQAILLDYAITQICAEMGILEGQENS